MQNITNWDKQDLTSEWVLSYKIDGVCAIWDQTDKIWRSRANKELYNIPKPTEQTGTFCEVFLGSFKETIQATRTKNKQIYISTEHLFSLDPLDKRLFICYINNPSKEVILEYLNKVNNLGYEGLVLRQLNKWLKVKPTNTYDVKVIALQEGKGKFKNKLGAIITPMGKVGTGFNNVDREIFWKDKNSLVGTIIEVSCLSLTENNKFRHPRFIRLRPDKG